MHDGLGGGGEVGHARVAARTAPVEAADLGWILLLPALALAAALIALLAPLGGRLLLPDPGYHYWMTTGVRKPSVDVGYAIAVVLAIAYAVAIVGLKGALRLRPVVRRALVALVQLGGLALVVACWRAQRGLATSEGAKLYFTPATLLAAAAAALLVCAAVRLRDRLPHGEALRTLARRLDARAVAWACLAVALLATVVWLLPALHTDRSTPSGNAYLSALFLDEAAAVVDGRSPLVNMVAYGNLWPYLVALPLRAFGMTYAVYTATMASITLLALLAVYDLLRRVARSAPLALGLYLPVLATGFFVEQWIATERYDPGTYFGMFPLRYAGPYLLAWLTARQLGRPADGRWSLRLLFALAGLVALNNVDFGGAALVATAAALLVVRRPRERAQLGRLALDALAGLAGALALVTLLTLARDGSL
ncbi:MAG TPA: hypothetical protein VFV85_03035, partial [Conexibacter sp.]|nr:hypothetical protein [Conexibacter sp.]